MNVYLGWVQGSDMASRYVHLSGRDIDHVLLKLNHIPTSEEDKAKDNFSLKSCARCNLKNPPGHKFCSRCGAILDEETAREEMKKNLYKSGASGVMERLIRDDEFRAMLERKIEELGKDNR